MNVSTIEWNRLILNEPASLPKILLHLHKEVWEYDKITEIKYVLQTSLKSYDVQLSNTYIDVVDHDLGVILYQARIIGNPPVGILRLYEDEGFYDNMLLPKNTMITIIAED